MIWALLFAIVAGAGAAQAATIPVTVTFQSASPIIMGEQTIQPTQDCCNSSIFPAQGPYGLAQPAIPQSVSFYITTAAGNLRLGIYDATGPSGGPGKLVAQTAAFAPTCSPAPCWVTRPVTASPTMRPGNYWIAYHPSSDTLGFRYGSGGSIRAVYYTMPFGSLPTTYSTNPSTVPVKWSLYATLMPTGPPPPLTVSFNPPSPSIACEAAPGSVVSMITAAGGNGGPITWNMTGDTGNFKLNVTPSVVNVTVGPSGIAPPDCGATRSVDITATQ